MNCIILKRKLLVAFFAGFVVLFSLIYLFFVMDEDVGEMKSGVVLVVCSPEYTISLLEADSAKLYVSVDGMEGEKKITLSLKPSYRTQVQYSGIYVSDSLVATSSLLLDYSKKADTLITLARLRDAKSEIEKMKKTRKHQYDELSYFISTHDSLDEGYDDAVVYRDSIGRELADYKIIISRLTKCLDNSKFNVDYTPLIYVKSINEKCSGRVLGGKRVAFVRVDTKKEHYTFNIPFFQIRRLLSYSFYSLIPVSSSVVDPSNGEVTIECSKATIDIKANSSVVWYPSSDGAPLLDTNMRFLGMYSKGKYITSNRIFYEMKKNAK